MGLDIQFLHLFIFLLLLAVARGQHQGYGDHRFRGQHSTNTPSGPFKGNRPHHDVPSQPTHDSGQWQVYTGREPPSNSFKDFRQNQGGNFKQDPGFRGQHGNKDLRPDQGIRGQPTKLKDLRQEQVLRGQAGYEGPLNNFKDSRKKQRPGSQYETPFKEYARPEEYQTRLESTAILNTFKGRPINNVPLDAFNDFEQEGGLKSRPGKEPASNEFRQAQWLKNRPGHDGLANSFKDFGQGQGVKFRPEYDAYLNSFNDQSHQGYAQSYSQYEQGKTYPSYEQASDFRQVQGPSPPVVTPPHSYSQTHSSVAKGSPSSKDSAFKVVEPPSGPHKEQRQKAVASNQAPLTYEAPVNSYGRPRGPNYVTVPPPTEELYGDSGGHGAPVYADGGGYGGGGHGDADFGGGYGGGDLGGGHGGGDFGGGDFGGGHGGGDFGGGHGGGDFGGGHGGGDYGGGYGGGDLGGGHGGGDLGGGYGGGGGHGGGYGGGGGGHGGGGGKGDGPYVGRVKIQVYRGPTQKEGWKQFAPWGYYVTQPRNQKGKGNGYH